MPHVLLVHESESIRAELKQALQAEDFKVTEADSSGAAVREIWGGSFDVAVVSGRSFTGSDSTEVRPGASLSNRARSSRGAACELSSTRSHR